MGTLQFFDAGPGRVVAFDTRAVKDEAESTKAGRLICRDVEYITIMNPGDRSSRAHRPVTPKDKGMFAKQYEHWKRSLAPPSEGTPLDDWSGCTRRQAEELRHLGVRTVEQLEALDEQRALAIGLEYDELRKRAHDFLEAAKGASPLTQLRAENAELKSRNAELTEQLRDALSEVRALREETPEPADTSIKPASKKGAPSKRGAQG